MKKLLLLSLILLVCCPSSVSADTSIQNPSYVRIEEDGVGFYKTPTNLDSELLFILEKSYYLKIVDTSTVFYQVEIFDNTNGFSKLLGYVKKSDVVDQTETPVAPLYPRVNVSPSVNSVDLKSEYVGSSHTLAYCLKGQQLYYYGAINYANTIWYYVRMGNEFGYVNANFITAPNISLHPTPLPAKPPLTPPITDETPKEPIVESNDGVIQLVLILLICIPAVIIVALLFVPSKTTKKSTPIYSNNAPIKKKTIYFDDKDEYNDSDLL